MLPNGSLLSFLAVLLPMLGLQSFLGSVVYLTATRLLLIRSPIKGESLTISFVAWVVVAFTELLLLMGLIMDLAGGWLLHGDILMTLSLILALQSFLPLYLIAVASRRRISNRLNYAWPLFLAVGNFVALLPDIISTQMPSIVALLHSTDWRFPLLASITTCTLWGMAVAKAAIIPKA
jgi:asparagine N-glycosylation enzyme membrane subunit Stt3